jgi:glycosyltransferase involved in cell wall biosynthesis
VSATLPTFSVVIPTYNRPRELAACLRALADLDFPHDRFEVVVVDDGSPVPPEGVVASFRPRLDLVLLSRPNAGPGDARNAGVSRARGEYIAFTDDDCAPEPSWLTALADRLASSPGALVGGRTVNALPGNRYAAASQTLITYIYDYYNANPDRARFFASNNIAVPRDRFLAMGGFDARFPKAAAEDRDFSDRWVAAGYPAVYAPHAVVRHAHPLRLGTFGRQHFNYGRGAYRFHRLRAARGAGPVRLEPLSFYVNLVRFPLAPPAAGRGLPEAALLVLAQLTNAAGFFYEQLWAGAGQRVGPPRRGVCECES